MISAEKIQSNWDVHLKLINHFITDRKDQVLDMVKSMEDYYAIAPASIKVHYHSAFPGGYVEHVNRVVQMSLKMKEFYLSMGGKVDFTDEELVFSALFHDLGKIGDGERENYIASSDDWRKEKMGELYTNNQDLDFMLIQDRSLYILQKFGIPLNQKEYLAIRCHDGVFDEANKAYFINFNPKSKFKTNLVYILQSSDYLASKIECDMYEDRLVESVKGLIKPRYNNKK